MKRFVTAILLLGFLTVTHAQDHRPPRRDFSPEEYWENLKTFVTKEASLTDDEAAVFYPMLKELMDEQHKNRRRSFEISRSCNEYTTDEEYGTAVEKLLEIDVDNKRLEETYYKKFHTVMSWEKVFKVRRALARYNREALNRFNPRRGHHGPPPPPPGGHNRHDHGE